MRPSRSSFACSVRSSTTSLAVATMGAAKRLAATAASATACFELSARKASADLESILPSVFFRKGTTRRAWMRAAPPQQPNWHGPGVSQTMAARRISGENGTKNNGTENSVKMASSSIAASQNVPHIAGSSASSALGSLEGTLPCEVSAAGGGVGVTWSQFDVSVAGAAPTSDLNVLRPQRRYTHRTASAVRGPNMTRGVPRAKDHALALLAAVHPLPVVVGPRGATLSPPSARVTVARLRNSSSRGPTGRGAASRA